MSGHLDLGDKVLAQIQCVRSTSASSGELTGKGAFCRRRVKYPVGRAAIRFEYESRRGPPGPIARNASAGLSQTALSQVLGIMRPGLVPLLDGLETKRLIERTPSTADRRPHALFVTAEGNALLARADALVAEREKRLIKKIGAAGHKQLLQILAVFGKPQ